MTSLKETLKQLSKKNVIPADITERNDLLRLLGYDCIKTFYWLDNLIAMLFLEDVYLIAPWTINVRYVDPVFKVVQADVYFELLECVIPMWMCVDSIIDAGKAPLFSPDNDVIQDMAFMCENQETSLLSSMFLDPVKDSDGEMYYPELSFHIQYVLDVIFGIRGYDTPNGKTFVATDINLADKWRKAIVNEGKHKMKTIVKSDRYRRFVLGIDDLMSKHKGFVDAETTNTDNTVLLKLTSKL